MHDGFREISIAEGGRATSLEILGSGLIDYRINSPFHFLYQLSDNVTRMYHYVQLTTINQQLEVSSQLITFSFYFFRFYFFLLCEV